MNLVRLQQTKAELRAAGRAVDSMAAARNFEEFLEAWQSFLDRAEKVWIKAERECQPIRNVFEPWQGTYKRLRREDALLAYLHHARNADHHTIQRVTVMAKDVRVKVAPGGTATIDFDPKTRSIRVEGDVLEWSSGPERYALLAFEDRGICYEPPTEHLGVALSNVDPLTVARRGLKFYTDFVEKIEQKLCQSS